MAQRTAFKYRAPTVYSVKLRLLEAAISTDVCADVLADLGTAVRRCAERIARAPDNEGVVDVNCENVEGLLGAAYVTCQVKITVVTSAALKLIASKKDFEVRAMGPRHDSHSKVEVLWALGNFFKHRDEWKRSDWDKPTGFARHTIPVLKAIGLEDGSSGNLRTGAEVLGNSTYAQMHVFSDIIDVWGQAVLDAAKAAIPA